MLEVEDPRTALPLPHVEQIRCIAILVFDQNHNMIGNLQFRKVGALCLPPNFGNSSRKHGFHFHATHVSKDSVRLTFLRHGQSTWNQQNIFIGMTDTPLTPEGRQEALSAGKVLATLDYEFDVVYTSLLKRSTNTVSLVLQELNLEWLPVIKDWRLNERNYGALVGTNKKQCVDLYGKDQVKRWRRSWDEPPPPMQKDSPYWPYRDRRYEILGIKEDDIPTSESLKDVTKRTSVFWKEVIVPQLTKGKRILIVGHENNLRSLIKPLDNISNEDIINVELPRAIPLVYELDRHTLKPIPQEGSAPGLNGRYLCTPAQLQSIAERDYKQVYDVNSSFGRGSGPNKPPPAEVVRASTAHHTNSVHHRFILLVLLCLVWNRIATARCCSPPPVTRRPSRAPTLSPSRIPSAFPTRRPSRSPTPIPTKLPSAAPTRRPSRSPTFSPSEIPTEEPTYMPSQPTSQPSSTPTTLTPRPSPHPTIRPTESPSFTPTVVPTRQPTTKPTFKPSIRPSPKPTRQPTVVPSTEPTAEPTLRPSSEPTAQPSITPSRAPSVVPTVGPTQEPSEMPTISFKPSPRPSRNPTTKPTPTPTIAPSTAIATAITLGLSQTFVNIDATSFLSSSSNSDAFKLAVADSIEGIQEADVTIESAADSSGAAIRSAQPGHQRHLRRSTAISSSKMFIIMAVPEITIEYLIAFVMEELGYDNTTLAVHQTSARLSGAVEDGTFLENLRAAVLLLGADAALLNVTSTSVVLISSSAAVLRSAAPSVQPTVYPATSTKVGSLYGNWPLYLKAVVLGVAALILLIVLIVLFMWRSSFFGCIERICPGCRQKSSADPLSTSAPPDAEAAPGDQVSASGDSTAAAAATETGDAASVPPAARRRLTLLSLFGATAPTPPEAETTTESDPPSSIDIAQVDVEQGQHLQNEENERSDIPAVSQGPPPAISELGEITKDALHEPFAEHCEENTSSALLATENLALDSLENTSSSNTNVIQGSNAATTSITVLPSESPRTPTFLDYMASALAMMMPDGDEEEDEQSLASERPSAAADPREVGQHPSEPIVDAALGPESDLETASVAVEQGNVQAPVPIMDNSRSADAETDMNPGAEIPKEEQTPPVMTTPQDVSTTATMTMAPPPPLSPPQVEKSKSPFRKAAKRFSALIHQRPPTTATTVVDAADTASAEEPPVLPPNSSGDNADAQQRPNTESEAATGPEIAPEVETGPGVAVDGNKLKSPLKAAARRWSQFMLPAKPSAEATLAVTTAHREGDGQSSNLDSPNVDATNETASSQQADDMESQEAASRKKSKSAVHRAARRLSAFMQSKTVKHPATTEESETSNVDSSEPHGLSPPSVQGSSAEGPEILNNDTADTVSAVPPPPPSPPLEAESGAAPAVSPPAPKRASVLIAEWLFGSLAAAPMTDEGARASRDMEVAAGENRTPFRNTSAPLPPSTSEIAEPPASASASLPPLSPRSSIAGTPLKSVSNQRLPSSGAFTKPKSILKTSGSGSGARTPSPMRGPRVAFFEEDAKPVSSGATSSTVTSAPVPSEAKEVKSVAAPPTIASSSSPRRGSLLDIMSAAIALMVPDGISEEEEESATEEEEEKEEEKEKKEEEEKEDENHFNGPDCNDSARARPAKASPKILPSANQTKNSQPSAVGFESPAKVRTRTVDKDETIVIKLSSAASPPRSGFNPMRLFSPSRSKSQPHTSIDNDVPGSVPLPIVQLGDEPAPVRESSAKRTRSSFSRRLSAASQATGAATVTTFSAPSSVPGVLSMELPPSEQTTVPALAPAPGRAPETPPRRSSLSAPSPEMRRLYSVAPPVVNYAKRGPQPPPGASFVKPKTNVRDL